MGRGAGKSSGGRGNGSAGCGKGGRKPKDSAVPTRRAGEVGACAALGNHIFTISLGNKAQYGDTLCMMKEAMMSTSVRSMAKIRARSLQLVFSPS